MATWQTNLKEAYKNPLSPYPELIPLELKAMLISSAALQKMYLYNENELNDQGLMDPIGDILHNKSAQIIHRYKNRILFMPTDRCPVLCRHCFRKNELGTKNEIFDQDFEKSLDYIRNRPDVNEIIFTGGDPLILSSSKLKKYLEKFKSISHIKFVRFHTKTPIVLPERIDDEFLDLLKWSVEQFELVHLALHINHVDEFSNKVNNAIKKLLTTGVQLISQSVLLKGINDTNKNLKELFLEICKKQIRPYYLHHPDQVKGGMHFYIDIEKGRRLYASLRNELPGWALPHYVIDIPGGEGKSLAYNPESFTYQGKLINKDSNLTQL